MSTHVAGDDAVTVFDAERRRLFGIAYRILGSAPDAEDVVQETWIRWQSCDRGGIRNTAAFLTTVTTRLAINELRSAHAQRETYIGPWLPTPVDTSSDPTLGAERDEALSLAVLLLMERLTPAERAAFTLRQAFDYPYGQIAEILGVTDVHARQLVSRARTHLEAARAHSVDGEKHRRLFRVFLAAARGGDRARLESLLAEDAVSYTDGGGAVHRTARRPIVGRDTLVRFLHGVSTWFWGDVEVELVEANGRESALLRREGSVFALLTIAAREEHVSHVLWVMAPDKLEPLRRAAA